jgi:enoyl-[acyl-carrier protein] reductase III
MTSETRRPACCGKYMHNSPEDCVALITGGTRGIGRAIALRLARERPKHIVVSYCMNHDAARKTVQDLEAAGVSASSIATDVGNEKLLEEMFRTIRERFGRLDIFVSNAARTAFRPGVELSSRSWRRIMEMNAEAFLLGSRLSFDLMKANSGGRIIGISSLGSRFYAPNYAGLGAAKAAMECLARYLAVEMAPFGVNVNVVCGGFVDTESMKIIPDYERLISYVRSRTPAGRLATPDDLAGVVAFLCSPESDWIRGQTIVADGGFSLMG